MRHSIVRAALIKTLFRTLRIFGRHSEIGVVRRNFDRVGQSFLFREKWNFTQVSAAGVPAEWVNPSNEEGSRFILYLHGGAFVSGSSKAYRGLVWRIAGQTAARILVIDYRLSPEHLFPAALEDSTAAYEWLLSQGMGPDGISVVGDSAGGGLALSLLLALKDKSIPLPACVVCLSPWVDLSCSSPSLESNAAKDPILIPASCRDRAKSYAGEAYLCDPYVSPVFGDLTGFPPLLILVGSDEVLLDDARRLAAKAGSDGVSFDLQVWKGMFHVWPYLAKYLPEGKAAIEQIARFLSKHMP
ncbi:MAG: alpha/beta hydrolase [Candidatus Aminicenantes bacterium]|nr:alpha/beta hydrolase [Candidatus Aminicenantes bacterium]